MTEPFDFDALSQKQIDALGSVAFGGGGHGFRTPTLESLVKRGLLNPVQIEEPISVGFFRWTTYTMPLPVHIAFCEWCSKQPDPESVG